MARDFEELADAFERGEIDPNVFDHEAHLAVGFHLLRRHDFLNALALYARRIQRMAADAGVPEKYNTTITVSFMSVLAERAEAFEGADAAAFLEANPDLFSKDLLARWYDRADLQTPLARRVFVLPKTAA